MDAIDNDSDHTEDCGRAAQYYADVREGAKHGDEDDREALPYAKRALDKARLECGCGG